MNFYLSCLNMSMFSDQFAFHPTGSTTAALASLFHHITNMLTAQHPYICSRHLSWLFQSLWYSPTFFFRQQTCHSASAWLHLQLAARHFVTQTALHWVWQIDFGASIHFCQLCSEKCDCSNQFCYQYIRSQSNNIEQHPSQVLYAIDSVIPPTNADTSGE